MISVLSQPSAQKGKKDRIHNGFALCNLLQNTDDLGAESLALISDLMYVPFAFTCLKPQSFFGHKLCRTRVVYPAVLTAYARVLDDSFTRALASPNITRRRLYSQQTDEHTVVSGSCPLSPFHRHVPSFHRA